MRKDVGSRFNDRPYGIQIALKVRSQQFDLHLRVSGPNLSNRIGKDECPAIRQIIAVNLPLGLLVVIIGASGRYWG